MSLKKQTRHAFTLIELLVTISIIAILASLGLWGVMRARNRAFEFAIENENSRLVQALESFKTQYGFYPPTGFNYSGATVNDFIPYLNRVSPNHRELDDADGVAGGPRRIDIWWNNVGQYLNAETSLAFWLSGIAKNKQYPLTYVNTSSTVAALPAYNYTPSDVPVGVSVERDVRYEFKNLFKWRTGTGSAIESIGTGSTPYPYVAVASQASGRYEPFVYFSMASLPAPLANNANTTLQTATNVPKWVVYLSGGGVTVGPYWFYDTADARNEYFSWDKFQLFSPGVDGLFSNSTHTSGNVSRNDKFERDNIGNFSEGRLEKLTL